MTIRGLRSWWRQESRDMRAKQNGSAILGRFIRCWHFPVFPSALRTYSGSWRRRNVAALERSDNVADRSHAFAVLKRGYTRLSCRAGPRVQATLFPFPARTPGSALRSGFYRRPQRSQRTLRVYPYVPSLSCHPIRVHPRKNHILEHGDNFHLRRPDGFFSSFPLFLFRDSNFEIRISRRNFWFRFRRVSRLPTTRAASARALRA